MSKKVLLVEDDIRFVKALAKEFKESGYHVFAVDSVQDLPHKVQFDYAVTDLRLKGGGFGLEAVSRILAVSPKCRIVVLTGYGSITTATEAIKRGAVDYLTKPSTFKEIENALLGKKYSAKSDLDDKARSLDQVEQEYIDFVLTRNNGNISKTAKELGLHRQSLQRKLRKYI